jgi:head-tail adaptor
MTEFAGTLRERIIIESKVTNRTPAGVQQEGWATVASCFAAVALDGVSPQSEGMALSAMPKVRVTIRKRDGIAIDQRIRWGERTFMVRQLLDDPMAKDRLTMRCDEVRA